MSLEVISCPHCGYGTTKSVNENLKSSLVNCVCSKCHKPYAYQNTYGNIKVIKK